MFILRRLVGSNWKPKLRQMVMHRQLSNGGGYYKKTIQLTRLRTDTDYQTDFHAQQIRAHQEAIRRHQAFLEKMRDQQCCDDDYEVEVIEVINVAVCCPAEVVDCICEREEAMKQRFNAIAQRERELVQRFKQKTLVHEEFHRATIRVHEEAIEAHQYLIERSRRR